MDTYHEALLAAAVAKVFLTYKSDGSLAGDRWDTHLSFQITPFHVDVFDGGQRERFTPEEWRAALKAHGG